MAEKLVAMAEGSKKPVKMQQDEFSGFSDDEQASVETADERIPEDTETKEVSSPRQLASVTLQNKKGDSNVKSLVEQIVAQFVPVIQSLCVTDRVVRAEAESDSWKEVASLLAKNPSLRNEKWSFAKQIKLQAQC